MIENVSFIDTWFWFLIVWLLWVIWRPWLGDEMSSLQWSINQDSQATKTLLYSVLSSSQAVNNSIDQPVDHPVDLKSKIFYFICISVNSPWIRWKAQWSIIVCPKWRPSQSINNMCNLLFHGLMLYRLLIFLSGMMTA